MTTTAQGRVRRSIRFAQLDAQSGPAARESMPRRERMTVSGRLEMPSCPHTQDWTGGMGLSPSGRFRVIEEPGERRRAFSREGIRMDWARVLIWVTAAVLCTVLLVQFAAIGASSLQIQKLERRVETAQNKKQELRSQLDQVSGDISVCTKAVELNLISSGGARSIYLTAPLGATLVLVETLPVGTAEPELRASAASLE